MTPEGGASLPGSRTCCATPAKKNRRHTSLRFSPRAPARGKPVPSGTLRLRSGQGGCWAGRRGFGDRSWNGPPMRPDASPTHNACRPVSPPLAGGAEPRPYRPKAGATRVTRCPLSQVAATKAYFVFVVGSSRKKPTRNAAGRRRARRIPRRYGWAGCGFSGFAVQRSVVFGARPAYAESFGGQGIL